MLITKTSNKKIDCQNEQWKDDHQNKQWIDWSPRQRNSLKRKRWPPRHTTNNQKMITKMRTPRRWSLQWNMCHPTKPKRKINLENNLQNK